jgi:NAD-dependent deacetylase
VYPAAGLMDFARLGVPVYYVDPNPATIHNAKNKVEVFPHVASIGMQMVRQRLITD